MSEAENNDASNESEHRTIASEIKLNPLGRKFSTAHGRKSISSVKSSFIQLRKQKSNQGEYISEENTIRQQFYDLFREPISEQYQRHFKKYFSGDISTKKFTVEEFSHLFQVTPVLSKQILRVFGLNNSNENNSISGEDIIRIARLLWISPMSVKAFILFKLFDDNNDEKITMDEIRLFYKNNIAEFKYFKNQKQYNEVVDIFLQGFFPQIHEKQEEEIDFNEFYRILQQNPSLFKSLYLISIPDQDDDDESQTGLFRRWWMCIENNISRLVLILIYILISIGLIIYVIIYRISTNHTVWQVIARVGGMLVNYNYVVSIVLMLKQTMTIMRRLKFIRLYVPVDDHIDAHRFVGTMLLISSMIHSLGHIVQFATHTEKHSWSQSMFTTAAGIGWVGHSATITGDILFVLILLMCICASQFIRQRSGLYQLFFYTHHLFWPIFILLIIHGENFWKWSVAPMTLLLIEKIYSLKRHSPKYGRTRLISVRIEDENVLSLIIERPANFHFRIGEYINICLPNIVHYEWHPFTINSSPERKDILRLTIMKKRNWTRKVYEHFDSQLKVNDNELNQVTDRKNSTHHSSERYTRNVSFIPREIRFSINQKDAVARIEGPFGTCTSYIFDCEHVLLIGGGIGITPYISALESLIYQLREKRCICYNCGTVNYNPSKLADQKLKKVDFIWINRDIQNFSWFLNVLDEFETEQDLYLNSKTINSNDQQTRYLDIHLYCTSVQSAQNNMLANLPYNLISNMYETMKHQDIHTHLKTTTHFGRPPWKLLFSKFKAEHRSTNVFFTGNKSMGDQIRKHCNEYAFKYQHEPFF